MKNLAPVFGGLGTAVGIVSRTRTGERRKVEKTSESEGHTKDSEKRRRASPPHEGGIDIRI